MEDAVKCGAPERELMVMTPISKRLCCNVRTMRNKNLRDVCPAFPTSQNKRRSVFGASAAIYVHTRRAKPLDDGSMPSSDRGRERRRGER